MLEIIVHYSEHFLSIAFFLYILTVTVTIILDNRPPVVSMAWLITLFFLPYFGIVIYLYVGVNWRKKKLMKQLPEEYILATLGPIIEEQQGYLEAIRSTDDNDLEKCMTLLLGSNHSVITFRNEIQMFHRGEAFFNSLEQDLINARSSIHMQFYIWRSDELGRRIKKILIEKASQGVDVKLIFDGVGCFFKMSRKYKRGLKAAGVEYKYFLDPLNPLSGRLVNYRNHRKIVVIDGETGYTGGMNLGQEYITGGKRFESWRDTGIRIRNNGVKMLQMIFMTDWYNSGGKLGPEGRSFPEYKPNFSGPVKMQIAASGPDSRWHSIKQLIFTMITNANSEVLIQSPYFVPDETIVASMETAALSGIRVKLIMTGIPDKRIPLWVARTYFETLLDAGVEVYMYRKGFYHPKAVIVDRRFATLGTCNMDVRSFHLDYEVNISLYDENAAMELAAEFERDLLHCRRIERHDIDSYPRIFKLRNSIFRILAPLL